MMFENQINSVYILGLGALGALYAAYLYDLDPKLVTIIADKNRITAYQQNGVSVNGKVYHFNYIKPEASKLLPADLLIIAVKSPQLEQAITDIKPFVGTETIVISILNGITSEAAIGAKIGIQHLLYAYGLGMDAVREGNTVTYKNAGQLVFGEKNNTVLSERVKAVKSLFERAKIPCQIPADMVKAMWMKFMLNTGINQASAVLRADYGVFQQNKDAQQLMVAAAREVVAIAQKMDIGLGEKDVDEFIRIIKTLNPEGKTSMLQDIEAGRKTEVAIFAGEVIALGKKLGVPTPVNQTLFQIIRVMESRRHQ